VNKDWLCEDQAAGIRFSLEVEERLFRHCTAHQEIEIVQTSALGRVLALDSRFMLSERDEPFYHEMLVHPALLAHEQPERVLIVGGGDGGALRETLRHPAVREAALVEIDAAVIAASREHLATVHAGAFDDPRVQIAISPGEAFLPEISRAFDVIVVDSTDPVGPGHALFEREFLVACREALRSGGVIALQAGTPFYRPDVLTNLVANLRGTFAQVAPYVGFVPLYPSGMWAYVLAGDRGLEVEETVLRERFRARKLDTRYYTPRLHRAAFALPRFVEELLAPVKEGQ